jgi:hypothetical protein
MVRAAVDHGDKIRNKIIGIMERREGEKGVEKQRRPGETRKLKKTVLSQTS